ncbi:Amino acid ABC transporter permease [Candidatus Bealeia paramacronuclearis]|uniref:Amino acid ABC transporter permease n=1 Tax=Candidatus Bealeia paramacronuclearis TaxID=1921001 RepID=A0ABZ2C238_9PROT|nr:Amino acid ABC transporter permease [Candidatus Bealeia paramacronuclearis]
MILQFERILPSIPYILEGVQVTLFYTVTSLTLGFFLGIILAMMKVGSFKILQLFAQFYTSIFRGTPLLLQLTLIYFASPEITGYKISAWEAGVLAFSLNSGAYVSEIIRGGILAVDRGQTEAALSLGVSYFSMMKDIILPQAIKNILPALVNEAVNLLKESAMVSVIGGTDILKRANVVASEKYIYFEPLIVAGALYYVLVMILSSLAKILERKMARS